MAVINDVDNNVADPSSKEVQELRAGQDWLKRHIESGVVDFIKEYGLTDVEVTVMTQRMGAYVRGTRVEATNSVDLHITTRVKVSL